MSKRKWEDSGVPIKDICGLMTSISLFGGVWFWRFANREWVLSQQMRTLLKLMEKGRLHFPQKIMGTTNNDRTKGEP